MELPDLSLFLRTRFTKDIECKIDLRSHLSLIKLYVEIIVVTPPITPKIKIMYS